MFEDKLAQQVAQITHDAGDAILEIYQRDFEVVEKSDSSPLTEADLAAHNVIIKGLESISTLPILSEESADIDWQTRREWQDYWLVDPLDGTKEFVKKNGEFTVNIALISDGKPVRGLGYAPGLEANDVGVSGKGAYKTESGGTTMIPPKPHVSGETWNVVGSRSHQSPAIQALLEQLDGDSELIAMGSSLKLCLVAEGKAHIYPRLGPTSEWDTGAAQAVVEAAGGKVTVIESEDAPLAANQPALRYNQKESILNPYFLVSC